jgi:protein-S-isoprenylcysteine O-methyltransferase Ste14/membrane protease YdiL (CAAX protease family)
MHEELRLCFLALYIVGPAVALPGLLRRRLTASATERREEGWRWYIPPIMLPIEWLLPPPLILLGPGEIQAEWLPVRLLGFAVSLGGVAVLVWAAVALGRFLVHEAAIFQDHTLITSGPYRFVRHPIYSGYLALLLGSGIGMLNIWLLLLWPLSLLAILVQAGAEERLLLSKFGQAYRLYTGGTGRIVPRLWDRASLPMNDGQPVHGPSDSCTSDDCVANVVIAWAGTLLASTLPAIIGTRLMPEQAGSLLRSLVLIGLPVCGLALLLLLALLRPTARPMRLPLLMLLAFLVGWRVLTPQITRSAAWLEWQETQPIGMSLATSRLQWVPPVLLMTLVAWGAGLGRRQMFLAIGHWHAPVIAEALFPLKGWTWFPRMFVLFLFLGFVFTVPVWVIAFEPDFTKADRVLVHLPGILSGSALNAMCEEYIFRAVLLGCFIPALGTRHALGLSGVLFGLEHWETAGITALLGCYGGWIYAKSMAETRGWSWALVQHFFGDVPIYAIVAMARQ